MIKYEERVARAKTYNTENIKKKLDKQRKYQERLNRAKTHNMTIQHAEDVVYAEPDEDIKYLEEQVDYLGLPPNNFLEKGIAYILQHSLKCQVLFN